MGTSPQTTLQQAHDIAQALHDQLNAAVPTNAADSETLSNALFNADTILTAINQEMMASRSGQMQAAGNELTSAVKNLSGLKDQLAGIAGRVGTLADIAGKVDCLLSACRSLFKI